LPKTASTSKLPESIGINGSGDHLKRMNMDVEMNGQDGHVSTAYIRPRRKHYPMPDAKPSEYLVGSQLDEALAAGENIEVYWPLEEEDDIRCWAQVEALWYAYHLFSINVAWRVD
jgi:actin-related protein 9